MLAFLPEIHETDTIGDRMHQLIIFYMRENNEMDKRDDSSSAGFRGGITAADGEALAELHRKITEFGIGRLYDELTKSFGKEHLPKSADNFRRSLSQLRTGFGPLRSYSILRKTLELLELEPNTFFRANLESSQNGKTQVSRQEIQGWISDSATRAAEQTIHKFTELHATPRAGRRSEQFDLILSLRLFRDFERDGTMGRDRLIAFQHSFVLAYRQVFKSLPQDPLLRELYDCAATSFFSPDTLTHVNLRMCIIANQLYILQKLAGLSKYTRPFYTRALVLDIFLPVKLSGKRIDFSVKVDEIIQQYLTFSSRTRLIKINEGSAMIQRIDTLLTRLLDSVGLIFDPVLDGILSKLQEYYSMMKSVTDPALQNNKPVKLVPLEVKLEIFHINYLQSISSALSELNAEIEATISE